MNRHPAALVALAGVATLALAACQKTGDPAANATSEAAAVAPDAKPGLALGNGRLVLPAVKGNPAAAYFDLVNGSDKPVTLASVSVSVAGAGMAMLHETKQMDGHSSMMEMAAPEIQPGQTLAMAPGGKHVMIDDVPATLTPGSTVEITLIFADGDKLSAPLAVKAPGDAN